MENIDARNVSVEKHFISFLMACSDSIVCIANNSTYTCKPTNFIETLFKIAEEGIPDDQNEQAECRSDNVTLLLTGYDIRWWAKTTRRKNRLLKVYECLQGYSEAKRYNVAIATLDEGKLVDIKHFNGTKQDVLVFFNTEIKARYIGNFLQDKTVFNLCYQEGDENNLKSWFTLKELEDNDIITMR